MNRACPALIVGVFAFSGCGGRSDIFIPEKQVDGSTSSYCGDNVLDPGEACDGSEFDGLTCLDFGCTSGVLICTPQCAIDSGSCNGCGGTCGDGMVDPQEECDGMEFAGRTCLDYGCQGGILTCNSDCTVSAELCTGCTSMCGDGVLQPSEECEWNDLGGMTCADLGCLAGNLECTPDCLFDGSQCTGCNNTCGDNVIQPGEQCDGVNLYGFTCMDFSCTGGVLQCSADCIFDTTLCMGCVPGCGNAYLDPGEECDGMNLGGMTCQALGFGSGTLACTSSCTFDTSGCTP